jgi:hypothetical protein
MINYFLTRLKSLDREVSKKGRIKNIQVIVITITRTFKILDKNRKFYIQEDIWLSI